MWCAVLLAWPLVVAVKALWAPRWGGDLSDGGATFTFITGMILLGTGERAPSLRDLRFRSRMAGRLAEVERRLNEQDEAWTAWRAAQPGHQLHAVRDRGSAG